MGILKVNSKENPLISIITIAHNAGKTIEKTIRSVINQTYNNIEYIVIDGNSKDQTISILQKYNKNIDYWLSESDYGISDAFNKGIKLAKGELIGIINADDWYESTACEKIIQNYKPEYSTYCGKCKIWVTQNTSIIRDSQIQSLHKRMSIYHPTCFIRSDSYEAFGLYNTKYKTTMDYDLLLRLKVNGCKFKVIDDIISNFQLGGISNNNKIYGAMESLQIKNVYFPHRKTINLIEFIITIIKAKLYQLHSTKII